MTSAVLTPVRQGGATRVTGRLFRKQVLPVGAIDYKGKKIDFTADYLGTLAKSFEDSAYDAVKLLFAPGDNSHTVDPDRIRGDVKGFELTTDGLDMIVEATEDGAKVLSENPNLGVSARIVEDLTKADGRHFDAAIQHVLATVDPKVTGMRPWQAVELSNDDKDTTTVDLTDAPFTDEKEPVVPDTMTPEQVKERFAALTEEQRTALLTELAPKPTVTTKPDDMTDEAWAEIVAALQTDPAAAALSAEDRAALDLATAQRAEDRAALTTLQKDLALSKWREEKQTLLSAGVPKVILDLAEPVLALPTSAVIDLSETEKLDTSDVVRKMVDACKGIVDLSVRGEAPDEEDDIRESPTYKRWLSEHPTV